MFRFSRTIGLGAGIFLGIWSGFSLTQAQEIGFNERYALAENREAALAELIPGTETYYYYHCLHCQTIGKIGEARGFLDAWIAKVGINEQTQRMQTRQFILEYNRNAQATLDHLRSEFGINTDHPAPRKDEAAELPTKLDPNILDWSAWLKNFAPSLDGVENPGLARAIPYLNDAVNLRKWLSRIDRVDVPKLVELIVRELKLSDTQGFGWAPIHNQLTNAQLLELQSKLPKLLESNAYVQARLRRIRPNDDLSIDEPMVLRNHLEALEDFVKTLPESQNSLKALVLYHRLLWDERYGTLDRARFIQFISLPSNRPYRNADDIVKQSRRTQVDLGANYQAETMLPPIADDTGLVRRYLENFFQADANVDAFSTYIDRDFLQRVFVTTKILYGIGDAKTYYATLSPEEQRELQSRIEINFSTKNPTYYKPSDTVKLTLDLKNVPELLVKIYRINARNILLNQKQSIGTNIDLDGLVANLEKQFSYSQSADRRHREVIELPELAGGGVWVVDALSSGLRSRCLIHKGHLHALQTTSNTGDVLRVFDAEGKHVPTAKAIYGSKEYLAEKDGNIVIPFGREAKVDSLVLVDGSVASVQQFVHRAENYHLNSGFLVDPQSLLSGAQATVVIRPNLMCNGLPISLAQLDKPKLTVTSTDLDGIAATQTFSDLVLADSAELTKSILVPQRLASISFTLSGEVLALSNDTRVPVAASHSVSINESSSTDKTFDFYLTQTDTGYLIEARGRNGEAVGRLPVQMEFKLFGIGPTLSARLATDEKGIIDLGTLVNVERLKASADSLGTREFGLAAPAPTWPATYHALKGATISIAMNGDAGAEPIVFPSKGDEKVPGRYSLTEYRGGVVFASHESKVSLETGIMTIAGLEPGSYRLTDHASGRILQIAVVQGEVYDDAMVGQQKILATNRVRPVHIQEARMGAEKLEIKLGNPDRFTRVQVVASAFRPFSHLGLSLPTPDLPLAVASRLRIPSFYINSLKLDEECQYVLQRQRGKKYLGTLLPQPSVLLNPWELAITQNSARDAMLGEELGRMEAPSPAFDNPSMAPGAVNVAHSNGLPDYEFLQRASVILTNGKYDETGKLSVDRKLFEGMTYITIVVTHPTGSSYRTVALPVDGMRSYTDRRLAKSFPADDKLMERQSIQIMKGADKIDLGDATSTRARFYRSIPDVFQLYKTLLPNQPNFEKFECLTRWSDLTDTQKEVHYSDLACHELNLFLLHHDRAFFDRVVRPYLANKMQKQFMDDYVLDADLEKYTRPWKLSQLNAVERVLLAKKLAMQTDRTKRWMGDNVSAIKSNSAEDSRRFATALMSILLADDKAGSSEGFNGRWMDRGRVPNDFAVNGPGGFGGSGQGSDKDAAPSERFLYEMEELSAKADESKQAPEWKKLKSERRRQLSLGRSTGQLYATLESTRKWADSNYFRLILSNQNADLIRPSQFWLDLLNHSGESPFVSEHLDSAANSVHEAILSLAVLGLPLKADPVELTVEQGRLVASNAKLSIAFVQGIERIEASQQPSTVLASQNIYLASDPIESAAPVQEKSLIKGVVYRQRVVLTNPSPSMVRIQVLQQIPQGAIALENAKLVSGQKLDLAPFATQELTTKFYFPTSGTFGHYGAQFAIDDKHVIGIASCSLSVLDKPESVDETSWSYISSWGTSEQVLEYLKKANLAKTNLDAIAWRMSDRKFYDSCIAMLTNFGWYHTTLWGYSLKHNDATRLRELLDHLDSVVNRVGPVLEAEIMQVEPVDRLTFEHLDFRPLVVARAHQLGAKRVILNDGLLVQYNQLMNHLSYQKAIDNEQRLTLVYYMLLQNRIEEAIALFAQVDAESLDSKLQHDYFAAYLYMLQGKFEEADAVAEKYVSYPYPRWRDWFGQVHSHIAERKALQSGKTTEVASREDRKTESANRILSGAREQQNLSESELQAALDLVQEGDKMLIRYRNLAEVEISYYFMDVELLFSRNPFAQQDGGRLNTIEPNFGEKRKLALSRTTTDAALGLPESMKNKNVMIEVSGGGLTRSLIVYANSLVVNLSQNMGRLQVLTKESLHPLEGTYVKVFARDKNGAIKFYKDGYTDLRGQFDYASLSTNDLDTTARFAVLVLHPEKGTIVRELDPPNR